MKNVLLPALFLMTAFLTACASGPVQDRGPVDADEEPPAVRQQGLQELLTTAGSLPGTEAVPYLLEAARLLGDMNREVDALALLNVIDLEPLNLSLVADVLAARAELHLDENQAEAALALLTNPRLEVLPQLDQDRRIRVRLLRAQAYNLNNRHLDSVRERVQADRLLNAEERQENHELLWDDLLALPVPELEQLAAGELNFELQGWYELGLIGKAYQDNLDRQLIELENWQARWSRHPAASQMPRSMQLLETIAAERPRQVALLLPLDSNAGVVIRDAFMSAYLNVKQIGGSVPEIRFYNTSGNPDILALHQQARADGADMVVGPLLKEEVVQLASERNLGVPTLALNTIDGVRPLSRELYQFALSPESEARQIAIKAWNDGHRYAAILSPAMDTDDFYIRKRNSFIAQWRQLGGEIVAEELYREDYTASIERLLNLGDSTFRMEQLSSLIDEPLAFTQRRRQDVDFIFLIAPAAQARQIKPRLGYLYAGDIPVYASQDIFSGISRPLEDADLNGILFGDSPWLLSGDDALKTQTQSLFPQTTARNLRLQAFGVDAFRLYPRLRQLVAVPDSEIYGATGMLRIGQDRTVVRELSWARIQQGQASLLEGN